MRPQKKRLYSVNEWDPLRSVIVGTVDGYSPGWEFSRKASQWEKEEASRLVNLAFPKWYLDEVSEDLENLCSIFRSNGIEVSRPKWDLSSCQFDTPEWSASGFDLYNVRDLHVVFGNSLVVGAPSSRFRLFENSAFQKLFYEQFFEAGFSWISAPTPKLRGDYLKVIDGARNGLEHREDKIHSTLSGGLKETFHSLDEHEVIFDAANIIRFGEEALFLVSSTGNYKAALWLQQVLPEYKINITRAYRSSHLDSTILPLREGLVLLNAARVSQENTPEFLESWDKIYFDEPAPVCKKELDFHTEYRLPVYQKLLELGAQSPVGHISSPWAGLNVLSIDENTILVHDKQKPLIKVLENHGLTVVPVQMRHNYTMLGGLHCVTLDTIRSSG